MGSYRTECFVMFNPWQNGQEKSTPGLSATGQTKGLERHNTSGLSRTRYGVQCEPTERLDYVVSPLRRRKRDPPVTPKSKLAEPLVPSGSHCQPQFQVLTTDYLLRFRRTTGVSVNEPNPSSSLLLTPSPSDSNCHTESPGSATGLHPPGSSSPSASQSPANGKS